MRKPRRLLGAAVVLGATAAACYEADHLSQTGQLSVVVNPGSNYSFGTVPVGSGVSTQPDPYFTIRAQSDLDDDYVQSIVLVQPGCGSDFSLDLTQPYPGQGAEVYCMGGVSYGGALLATGSNPTGPCVFIDYLFGARFQPTQAGPQSCRVDITTVPKAGGSATVQSVFLSGTGISATYSMGVSPTSIDFGDVALGSSSGAQTVTVKNTGGSQFQFNGSNFDAAHFSVVPSIQGPYTLNPTGIQTFQVACNAGSAAATYNAPLWFFTPGNQGNLAQQVMLKCRAIATSVSANPSPVNLGMHLLGDSPTQVPVTITNTGGTTITLDNFTLTGTPGTEVTYPGGAPGTFALGAGSAALITVQYAPTSERDVGSLGTMTFNVNGTPNNVPLVGGAHTGSIGTNPASVDFGAVCAGSAASVDLTVFANAGGDVHLNGVSTPGAPFTATFGGAATLLAHHGNEVTITTTASPAMNEMPGDKTDHVDISTNIPGGGTVPIDLHAIVLAGGVAPTPALVHFGPNDLDKPSPVQTVTLTNCGDGDLTLTDASFTGSNGAEFAIVSPADPHVTITKTQSQQFLVVMTPHSPGAKTAQFVFSYAGGTAAVALDGTGIGAGSDGGTKDRETYYACAVGSPSGLIPLAVVAFALRRRRRR